jgi:ribose 1,5-bisphosphokinase
MNPAAAHIGPETTPIGPGRLVLVVGPSGAGKDTVLHLVRAACAHDTSIVFPRRTVTRPANADEDHDSVDEAQFDAALQDGAFALAWQAHGLCYGIPRALDDEVRLGRTVVCNVSRGIIPSARSRYTRTSCVLITAPKDILMARLTARARASDTSVSERIERNDTYSDISTDVIIDNAGNLDDSVRAFLNFLQTSQIA